MSHDSRIRANMFQFLAQKDCVNDIERVDRVQQV